MGTRWGHLPADRFRRPTIKDVAQLADVSSTTVSVVLNHQREGIRVPESTRERVHRAAAELGYTPNVLARNLRTRASSTIGFLSDEVTTTPFAVSMLAAAQDEAARRGYLLLVVNVGVNAVAEKQRDALDLLHQQQVSGIVYACMFHRHVEPPAGLPDKTVFLNAQAIGGGFPSIVPDDYQGAHDLVTELLDHGHRRIGFINDEEHPVAADQRFNGYRDALSERGIKADPALYIEAGPFVRGGLEIARLLELPPRERPTAVFCFNDRVAMGAYRVARYRGLHIPTDLSIVGFDDQEFIASELDPGLTTMRLPHPEMGKLAIEILLDQADPGLADATNGSSVHRILCELIRRESVAPPPLTEP